MLGVSVATYWVTMTPIAALLCVCVGWANVPRGRPFHQMRFTAEQRHVRMGV